MNNRARVELRDLDHVVEVLGEVSPDTAAPYRALEHISLNGKQQTAILEKADDRWQAAVQVALEYEQDYLARLFDFVRRGLTPARQHKLDEALSSVDDMYIRRVIRAEHPEVGDQVDTLMRSRSYDEMRAATGALRQLALDVRQMLMDPLLGTELGLQVSAVDAERRRFELADLAIDVTTATDYLLNIIAESPANERSRYSAERDHGSNPRPQQSYDEDRNDQRYRRALDARATAVRLGGRLLRVLRRESVLPDSSSST
jgi:hypothetical protein